MDFPPNQRWYCSMNFTVLAAANMCSSLTVVSMTFERFYSIIRPHKAASFNTVKRAKITIVCIVTLCILYNSPQMFFSDTIGRVCYLNYRNTLHYLYYSLFLIIGFAFPFISLLIMNSFIIHTLRCRSKSANTASHGQSEDQHAKDKNPERQIYTMLLLVTFGFLTLTTPAYALVLYINFYKGNTPYYYAGYHLFYQVALKLFYSNNGINFFLYVISGQKFQEDLKKLFMSNQKKRNNELTIYTTNTKSTSIT